MHHPQLRIIITLLPLLAVAACTPTDRAEPPQSSTPPTTMASVTPSSSPTPSQQELSKQAELAYRTAFDEIQKTLTTGGAMEAPPKLKSVTAASALTKYEALLRDQKQRGYSVSGTGFTRTTPAPGAVYNDSDPRLSIRVCDDRSQMTWTEGGASSPGYLVQGWAYGQLINGRVLIVEVDTRKSDRCDIA